MDAYVGCRIDEMRIAQWEAIKKEYYSRGLNPPILSKYLKQAFDETMLKLANDLNNKKLVKKLQQEIKDEEYRRRCAEILKQLDLPDYQQNLIDKVIQKHGRKN